MELAALSGLMAIGYAVSQLASPSKSSKSVLQKEGFHTLGLGILPQSTPPSEARVPFPSEYYTVGLQQYLTQEESSRISELNDRLNSLAAVGSTDGVQALKAQIQTIVGKAATRRSQSRGDDSSRAASNTAMAGTELDMMFRTPGGQTYPSEPNTGPQYGGPIAYATGMPPLRRSAGGQGPMPEPIDSATPLVQMVSSGVEASAAWTRGDTVVSALTGQPVDDFKHNNMQPFFGGRVKQNMTSTVNTSKLDMFTGAGTTQIQKQEITPMFNHNQPFGQPFGNEANADFVRSRIVDPGRRNNEKPFEPTRVGPSLGEKGGITGKGGFQQIEVNEIMKRAMPTTDKLRVATNPKLSYNNQVVPGVHFITAPALDSGEVRKYRPDTFFLNETGERNGVATGEVTKETSRPTQVLKYTTRTDTTEELLGTPASQEAFKSYVAGDYRTPMGQQFGGAGYRNNDASSYGAGPRDDYGASAIEIRPNERNGTQDRVMGLNLAPADTGLVAVHYEDDARPTRRGETVGNIRQTGTPVGYAGGAPSITTWDPSDVARTTIKETTVDFDYRGISGPGAGPERLKVYDPNDIAKPTQKSQLSNDSRIAGPAISVNKDFTSHDSAYNMRKNESKTSVAKLRKPMAGNGNIAVFKGEIHQKSNRLTADDLNDRALAVNRVSGMTPGTADLGRVQYRAPLKLDVSTERNMQVMVDAVENNPLNQSLRKNAIRDSMALEQLQGGRR
uniref:Uncharacterized protein n=1 Tax=viral metagenome TaxID=1070528 RepID=A0A6C0AMZ9_9ZZZZ